MYSSADTNNSIDLDIEGGSSTGFVALVNRLRTKFNGASKKYYVTAVRMFCSLL
jgi:nicotinamide riboside kinase